MSLIRVTQIWKASLNASENFKLIAGQLGDISLGELHIMSDLQYGSYNS